MAIIEVFFIEVEYSMDAILMQFWCPHTDSIAVGLCADILLQIVY